MSMRNLWENSFNEKGHSTMALEEERFLVRAKVITDCELEFGLHEDHDDCETTLTYMGAGSDYNHDFEYDNYMNGSSHIGFSVSM